MALCTICRRPLSVASDPLSVDCGGDCRRCMAEAGDPDCIDSIREVIAERIVGTGGISRATVDALAFVRHRVFTILPEAHFDDGILSLEWRKPGRRGAMLLFHGDGTVTTSVSDDIRGYASGGHEIALDAELPEGVAGMLESLAGGNPQGFAPA